MMSLKSLLLTSALAFALPAAADHDGNGEHCAMRKQNLVKNADTDHDGSVDKAEWSSMHEQHFDQMDANHDGKLTPDEAKACKHSAHNAKHAKGSTGFYKADQDHDGTLDKNEAKALPKVSQHFDAMDTDKDGTVDHDEVHQYMKNAPQ